MDKRKITDSFSSNNDEKFLIAQVLDLAEESDKKNIIKSSNFLSDSEAAVVEAALQYAGYNYYLYGGYENSERRCFVFNPYSVYLEDFTPSLEESDILILNIQLSAYDTGAKLTHRDYLGAIIGCGVKREMIGDIIVYDSGSYVLLKSFIFPYVADTLHEVGRFKVKCSESKQLIAIEPQFKEIRTTVASLRVDAVVSAAFNISRSSTLDLIREGRVFVSGRAISKPDNIIAEGDKLSVRGKGKVIFLKIDGKSVKGRYRLLLNKYI